MTFRDKYYQSPMQIQEHREYNYTYRDTITHIEMNEFYMFDAII